MCRKAFVATPVAEPQRLVGFFSLSAGSVNRSELPTTLAVAGIVVDGKDGAAASFYQRFGFLPLPGRSGCWLLAAASGCVWRLTPDV